MSVLFTSEILPLYGFLGTNHHRFTSAEISAFTTFLQNWLLIPPLEIKNIATCAPWLSYRSLITAKLRQPGRNPALKRHFENQGRSSNEKFRTSGIALVHNLSLVKHTLQTTLGGHQGSQPAGQHGDWPLFELFFNLQRCLLQPLALISALQRAPTQVLTWRITRPMCVDSNHRTSLEDDCEQPWPLPGSLGNHMGWPTAAPHKPFLTQTLWVSSLVFKVFWCQIAQRSCAVCTHQPCTKQPDTLKVEGETTPPYYLSLHYLRFWAVTCDY